MDPVVHFEMPWVDEKRVTEFYSKVFGWKMHSMSAKMGNYILATTTDTDDNGMIKKPGNINGGFFQKTDDQLAKFPMVVIAVEDIKASMEKVKQAGGKVFGEPVEIPHVGLYVSFVDSEGNRVNMLQPKM